MIVLAGLELGGLFIEEFFDVADSLIDLLIDVCQRFCQVVAVANKARLQLLLHVNLIPRGAGTDHGNLVQMNTNTHHVLRIRSTQHDVEVALDGFDVFLQRLQSWLILAPGVRPERWNLRSPDCIRERDDDAFQLVQLRSCLLQLMLDVGFLLPQCGLAFAFAFLNQGGDLGEK